MTEKTKQLKVDLKDVEILLFSREAYLQSLKALHKEGWTKIAEERRNTYNKIIKLIDKNKPKIQRETISKMEIIN